MKIKTGIITIITVLAGVLQAQVALHGLYTPIKLNHDTTVIYLRDYIGDAIIDEIQWPNELNNLSGVKDTLVFVGRMDRKMDLLKIRTSAEQTEILLINPSTVDTTIEIPVQSIEPGAKVQLIGDFNNWNRNSEPLQKNDHFYTTAKFLEPGKYAYKLLVNGEERLDTTNKVKIPNGFGSFNNILHVKHKDTAEVGDFSISLEGDLVKISYNDDKTGFFIFYNNRKINGHRSGEGDSAVIFLNPAEELKDDEFFDRKRAYLRIYSYARGKEGRNQLIPFHYGKPLMNVNDLERQDWHQARMYFLMVDRFNNGNKTNDHPTEDPGIHPKANYYGGDLFGVSQKIESGFFDSLSYNTIWLSPITQNPDDAWGYWDKGKVKSKFSAYHGYWPISNTKVDYRFGTSAQLQTLLDEAHNKNKNVILDYVANHVHQNHPVYQNHKDWATDLYLPDGTKNTELWDEQRLTTWFDDHLPTLDLRKWEVIEPMVDSALFWVTKYDFDGFRHDATKHIDELFWRTLTYRLRKNTNEPIIQIGETYGSPQLINSYISTGMLDAQFDFNLYDAAVSAFGQKDGDIKNLKSKLEEGLKVYGYHHLMGNITGNQDRARFITLASGEIDFREDHKLAGWDREIGKPSAEAYNRLALIHAFNNAIPGIPCTYYGDEYGMPGAGDPDNRRMMKFTGLDEDETALREKVIALNKLRSENLALIYGTTEVEILEEKVMKITRTYFDQQVIIYFNNSEKEVTIAMRINDETEFKNHFNTAVKDKLLKLPPLSFEYLTIK